MKVINRLTQFKAEYNFLKEVSDLLKEQGSEMSGEFLEAFEDILDLCFEENTNKAIKLKINDR